MENLFHIKIKHVPKMFGDDVPSKYVVTIADKIYEVEIDYVQRKNVPDYGDITNPDRPLKIEDFQSDTVAIDSSTLRPVDNHPLDEGERSRILRLIEQYYKSTEPTLEVVID